jgi:Ser/Thr protein kinase RdoA (MazF antagonist)
MAELRLLMTARPSRNPQVVLNAVAILNATSDTITRRSEAWSICHGDFKPNNLLLTEEGRILACDIVSTRCRVVLGDVAHFLNHAALQLYLRRHRVALVERAFCDGYFERANLASMEALNWIRLAGAVRIFLNRARWLPTWRSAISSLPLLWLIDRLVSEFYTP